MSQSPIPDLDEPLTPEERDEMIGELARKVVGRGMESPAILFLEMNKPISFIAGQSLIAASPFLMPLFGRAGIRKYSQLLSDRENIELLIRRIEDLSAEKDREKKK